MKKLIKPLQQWAMEDSDNRGVLVIATDEGKGSCCLTGTILNIAKAIAAQANQDAEIHRILLAGLIAASKSQRFLSLRARLIALLLK